MIPNIAGQNLQGVFGFQVHSKGCPKCGGDTVRDAADEMRCLQCGGLWFAGPVGWSSGRSPTREEARRTWDLPIPGTLRRNEARV